MGQTKKKSETFFVLPLVNDGDNPAPIYPDLFPSRLRHVKVLARWVAPPTVVAREIEVGRAEVGGSDGH